MQALSFKGKTTWLSRCFGGDRREVSKCEPNFLTESRPVAVRSLFGPGSCLPVPTGPASLSHHATASLQFGAHTDRSIRTPASEHPRLNTTGPHATAPPTAGTHPATGSTTTAGR